MTGDLMGSQVLPTPKKIQFYEGLYDPNSKPSTIFSTTKPTLIHELTIVLDPTFVSSFVGEVGKLYFHQKLGGLWYVWDIDDFVLKQYNFGSTTEPYAIIYGNISVYEELKITMEFGTTVNKSGKVGVFYDSESVLNMIGSISMEAT